MKYLNLDPAFTPFDGEAIEYKSMNFSGGEPHIKIQSQISLTDNVMITSRIKSFQDFGLLLLTVDALKRMGVLQIAAFIPYFPAARQDRVMIPGEPLSVKVYADIINQLQLTHILVFDPHSEVTPALLNNCINIPNYAYASKVLEQLPSDTVLISPDGGALKKIYNVANYINNIEVIECSKHRDVATGKLNGFHVNADDLEGKPCLILDDICDGGGTFLGLADALKDKNAGKLYLAVSHGIFSKGLETLTAAFDQIFTTDSFTDVQHTKVTQIKLAQLNIKY